MTLIDIATNVTRFAYGRGFLRSSVAIASLFLGFASPGFGASSGFVVITPKNEAEHRFVVQAEREEAQPDRTRVRVTWPLDEYMQVWLVVCEQSQLEHEQNLRSIMWGAKDGHDRQISIRRLDRSHITPAETGGFPHAYVEITLADEEMARSYVYIDFPRPVNDGGYYYSVDLAYYLDGPLGKDIEIYWEK